MSRLMAPAPWELGVILVCYVNVLFSSLLLLSFILKLSLAGCSCLSASGCRAWPLVEHWINLDLEIINQTKPLTKRMEWNGLGIEPRSQRFLMRDACILIQHLQCPWQHIHRHSYTNYSCPWGRRHENRAPAYCRIRSFDIKRHLKNPELVAS
jgi:hypothetical protein